MVGQHPGYFKAVFVKQTRHGLADISKFYHSLLARDKILFSDVLVASRILIG
jgi:hypothetical protein